MKKLISAVTSLCVAATMVSAVAPISSGAAETKGFALKTLDGASTTIDCSAGDVVVPCAIYLTESTADTSSVAVAASFTSGPEVAKVSIERVIDFSEEYYSSAQTFTKADGSTFETSYIPAWAGNFTRKGAYDGAGGSYNALTAKDKMEKLGCDYAYVAGGWLNSDGEYTYTGASSDAYPFLVFEVKFPKGIAAGDYTIEFVKTGADEEYPDNKATMIESGGTKYTEANGNLTVTPLTFTVSGSSTETSATQTTATTTKDNGTTTTKAATTQDTSNADIVIDLGNYTVPSGGGDVEMNVTMDPKGNYLTSVSAFMTAPDGIEWDGMEKKSPAFSSAITVNDAQMKFNFATLNGSEAKTCESGAVIATIYWIVPDTTADGEYKIGYDKFEVMNGTDVYNVAVINGTITVGDGGETSETTTSATTTSSTTTTTTTTTTSSTTTTEKQPGTPDYGDANCDGVVNVADVVVLNKWRNDNTSYNLTAQGKLNADCFAPKGGDEITDEDPLAILQSIVHLVTLPATALAE